MNYPIVTQKQKLDISFLLHMNTYKRRKGLSKSFAEVHTFKNTHMGEH